MAPGSGCPSLDLRADPGPRYLRHTPVLLSWDALAQNVQPMQHFSACYLKDTDCSEFIDQELAHYFRENQDSVASAGTLCAASKPTLRGTIKGYVRRREAQLAQPITELEADMAELERHTVRPGGRIRGSSWSFGG
ncbi:hypothetical protein NDU88_002793 [Pleurodeles waltl]|uniref:Uncharacterized protein n=1 Tax=Pleurodeles waltl TaxID=8319 RepID=A0AAV7UE27_PLEWA|nr:hypothetical protein NDU88_002793 [Pleurodeles waltl]